MDIDLKQKQEALARARELMAEGERKRAHARLLRQAQEFELGNKSVLSQDEFVRNVSQLIVQAAREGAQDRAEEFLERLANNACGEDAALRERAVVALSFCSGLLLEEQNQELLEKVTLLMVRWLKTEVAYLPVCDTVCRQLQQNGLRIFDEGRWQQFDAVLDVLFQIQSGVLEKGNVIRGLVSRTQDGLAAGHVLEELVLVALRGQGARQVLAERILTHLGRCSVIFLLEKLLHSQLKQERLRLVRLISETGKVAMAVFKEYLAKDLPWFGVRNIILLVTEMGDSVFLPLILPFLTHDDIRVQQQVIDCINELGGVDKKKYLLSALSLVNDELKAPLIMQLGQVGCAECTDVLLDIFSERDGLAAHVRDEILGQICIVLRVAPQQRAVILLRTFVEERERQSGGSHDAVSLIARRTLQILEPQLLILKKSVGDTQTPAQSSTAIEVEPRARLNLNALEKRIEQLLHDQKIVEATALIAENAISAAREKDFATAGVLFDRMLAVNPNALSEVIQVGELIEEEKSNTISSHQLSLWSDLYDFLDTDAFNALYHCQYTRQYQPDEVIVQQGDMNSVLYFINAGQVALTCRQGKKEVFLKRMNPGEIIGVGPFFDISVWTVTLTAISAVELQILERQPFLELLTEHQGLEATLSDYCRKSDNVAELLRVSGESRREEVRHPAQLMVINKVLDELGNPTQQQFKGRLEDVSMGGVSLMIHIPKKENACLYLGAHIISMLPVDMSEIRENRGQVVGVTVHDVAEQEYLMHVRFDRPMKGEDLKSILLQWRR